MMGTNETGYINKAVSYTHLDVYKRQVLSSCIYPSSYSYYFETVPYFHTYDAKQLFPVWMMCL